MTKDKLDVPNRNRGRFLAAIDVLLEHKAEPFNGASAAVLVEPIDALSQLGAQR